MITRSDLTWRSYVDHIWSTYCMRLSNMIIICYDRKWYATMTTLYDVHITATYDDRLWSPNATNTYDNHIWSWYTNGVDDNHIRPSCFILANDHHTWRPSMRSCTDIIYDERIWSWNMVIIYVHHISHTYAYRYTYYHMTYMVIMQIDHIWWSHHGVTAIIFGPHWNPFFGTRPLGLYARPASFAQGKLLVLRNSRMFQRVPSGHCFRTLSFMQNQQLSRYEADRPSVQTKRPRTKRHCTIISSEYMIILYEHRIRWTCWSWNMMIIYHHVSHIYIYIYI